MTSTSLPTDEVRELDRLIAMFDDAESLAFGEQVTLDSLMARRTKLTQGAA